MSLDARSGDERSNHEATTPTTRYDVGSLFFKYICTKIRQVKVGHVVDMPLTETLATLTRSSDV